MDDIPSSRFRAIVELVQISHGAHRMSFKRVERDGAQPDCRKKNAIDSTQPRNGSVKFEQVIRGLQTH